MSRRLTDEAQADHDNFEREFGYNGNCYCHLSPPCGSCTHPGSPLQQEENDACWQETCQHCDDTGDVHRTDGEYMGRCTCPAGHDGGAQ